MIATLTVVCSGGERAGAPTHDETVVADLGVDEFVGVVLLPTAQQRGKPSAGRPHAFGKHLVCGLCGDKVPVGKSLRGKILRAHRGGVLRAPLQALRR